MAIERKFETLEGTVFNLRPVSALVLNHIDILWDSKKPKPPVVEVEINKQRVKETNPHDPDYLQSIEEWKRAKAHANYTTIFGLGITDDVPKETVKLFAAITPEATPAEVKTFWVTSIVGTMTDECNALVERIVGQTMPTEQGLEQSKERFPADN